MNFIENKKHIKFNEEEEGTWKGPFFFIQGADSQFGMIENYLEGKEKPGWEKEKALARRCVAKINSMRPRPKFFVICGDLCDAWPFGDDVPMREAQEKDFIEIFSKVDKEIPVVCVCGNHDVGNQPTVETVARYRSIFGHDYFSFLAGGVLFLVLNSQYYFDGSEVPQLAREQEEWLEEQLTRARATGRGAVVFQHIPYFLRDPEETDAKYFALSLSARKPLLERLYNEGVRYVFCGHYHRNSGGKYKDLEVVVTSALGAQLGADEPGFRVVRVLEDSLSHRYHSIDEAPQGLSPVD